MHFLLKFSQFCDVKLKRFISYSWFCVETWTIGYQFKKVLSVL